MEAFEKVKLALRKHLLENKEKIAADLEDFRNKSEGNDIYNYVEKLSNSFALEDLSTSKVIIDCQFTDVDYYHVKDEKIFYSPPDSKTKDEITKKDSEILSESFFL